MTISRRLGRCKLAAISWSIGTCRETSRSSTNLTNCLGNSMKTKNQKGMRMLRNFRNNKLSKKSTKRSALLILSCVMESRTGLIRLRFRALFAKRKCLEMASWSNKFKLKSSKPKTPPTWSWTMMLTVPSTVKLSQSSSNFVRSQCWMPNHASWKAFTCVTCKPHQKTTESFTV